MDEQLRERVRDDLRGLLQGDLLFDDLSQLLYSTDASIFSVQPLGVVCPRSEADLVALVRYAEEHQIPLIARGAGTNPAGSAIGNGIVVDFARHLRSVLHLGADVVRVEPGVTYQQLERVLGPLGRRLPVDSLGHGPRTIGGMVATNAAGSRVANHGYLRDHILALRTVLDTGDVADLGEHSRWPAAEPAATRLQDIIEAVAALLHQHGQTLRRPSDRPSFDRSAYRLEDIAHDDQINLARLLTGSEGTLGLFSSVTLRTVPIPAGRALLLLGFGSLDAALHAADIAVEARPALCDLLDRRVLSLARGGGARVAEEISTEAEAVLLIELESDAPEQVRESALQLRDRLYHGNRLALQARVAFSPEQISHFWQLRECIYPGLFGLRGGARPTPFVEDIAVPRDRVATFLHRVQETLRRREVTAAYLVHAATGQVQTWPFLNLDEPGQRESVRELAEEIHQLAIGLGGTISSQNATGIARTPWIEAQYGERVKILTQLKSIFDPRHLFNPGKIIRQPGIPLAWPLRPAQSWPSPDTPEGNSTSALMLRWEPGEFRHETAACNACGSCRTEESHLRMCPIFRIDHSEEATPRAKANLIRSIFQSDAASRQIATDPVRAVADLCVNCKMCARECPSRVNVPKLMLEAKAANVAEFGMSRSDWAMARSESFARLGSSFARLTNLAMQSRSIRWILEKLLGVSRHQRMPTFAPVSFLRKARQRGWTRQPKKRGPRVAYFVDVFANYNDPLIGEATVAVLHHHGIEVYVPPGQRGCGMAPLAYGDLETARETVLHNLRLLAEAAREGYRIVCSEPSAAILWKLDAQHLIDDPDVELVARQTVELTTYLAEMLRQGKLRQDFRPLPLSIGHHIPCHVKALGSPPAGPLLLSLIPGLKTHTIDVSCSGMAGTFGLKAENYNRSLEAGAPMLAELTRPRVLFGSSECSPCRMQIEGGARKRALHPIQYLALAYGLLPELEARLNALR